MELEIGIRRCVSSSEYGGEILLDVSWGTRDESDLLFWKNAKNWEMKEKTIIPCIWHTWMKKLTKPVLPDEGSTLHVLTNSPHGDIVKSARFETGKRNFGVVVLNQPFLGRVRLVAYTETIKIEFRGQYWCRGVSQGQRIRKIAIHNDNHFRLNERH